MLQKFGTTLIVIGVLVIIGIVIHEIYTVDPVLACVAFGYICLFAGVIIKGFTG